MVQILFTIYVRIEGRGHKIYFFVDENFNVQQKYFCSLIFHKNLEWPLPQNMNLEIKFDVTYFTNKTEMYRINLLML